MLKPIDKKSISDHAIEQIASEIVDGDYVPGTKLPPERDLAEMMGITRMSLRPALRRLADLGLIDIRPGDGIYVMNYQEDATLDFVVFVITTGIGMSPQFLKSFTEWFSVTTDKAIEYACERATKKEIREIQSIIDRFPGEESDKFGPWFVDFVMSAMKASHNVMFVYTGNNFKRALSKLVSASTEFDFFPNPIEKVTYIYKKLLEGGLQLTCGGGFPIK